MPKTKDENMLVEYCDACGRPFEITAEISAKLSEPKLIDQSVFDPFGIVVTRMEVTTVTCPICWTEFIQKTIRSAPQKKSIDPIKIEAAPLVINDEDKDGIQTFGGDDA